VPRHASDRREPPLSARASQSPIQITPKNLSKLASKVARTQPGKIHMTMNQRCPVCKGRRTDGNGRTCQRCGGTGELVPLAIAYSDSPDRRLLSPSSSKDRIPQSTPAKKSLRRLDQ